MQKVIGIGETILDIIFKNEQPTAAVPGGSTFNGLISLGRTGVDVSFISEVGNDKVGDIIINFMKENGVRSDYICVYPDGKSPVSLAFLDEHNDAQYIFYKDYPSNRLDVAFPKIEKDDIVLFGSYFVLNPVLRSKVVDFLDYARDSGAILFYDINFRNNHKNEIVKLTPTIIENFEYADIIRGSRDDFSVLYGMTDGNAVYKNKIAFYCNNFICTNGGDNIQLRTKSISKDYPPRQIEAVSTIGAGDSFNAGLIYGLLTNRVTRDSLPNLSEREWNSIVQCAIDFSAQSCTSVENYVSKEWATEYKNR